MMGAQDRFEGGPMRRRRALHPILVALLTAVVAMVAMPAVAAPGDVAWEAISDFGRANGQGSLVLVSPNGATIFEVGSVFPRKPSDIVVQARAAADGSLRWSFRYRDPNQFQEHPVAATLSPDGGRLYITGVTRPFFTSFFPSHFLTLALDTADGAVLWVETFRGDNRPDRPEANVVRDIGISPNGDSVYVAGRQSFAGYSDYLTIAYDASTGAERWVQRYDGPSNGEDRPAALSVTADNTVIVTGTSFEIGQAANVVTVAYDGSDGTLRWSSSFDGAAHGRDAARTMSLSLDGADLVVSGSSGVGSSETRSNDVLVLDLDPATGAPK